jgi:hypothetical protein
VFLSFTQGEVIKFYRENYLSLILFRKKRAHVRNNNNKRKSAESKQQRAFINRTLCKATLLPSAAAVKEEAAIVM